jgi:predicted RecB family nuclease
MHHSEGTLVVSATDLVGHLACEHLTVLDRQAIGGGTPRPLRGDPELEVLRNRGLEHEAQYLSRLGDEAFDVMEIAEPGHDGDVLAALRQREAETLEAMQRGVDVVFQATFLDEREQVAWRGHADFLRKVPAETDLGRHGYEPEDTKLARHVKPSALLQLCHYAEQVERLQGARPDQIHVVLGGQERASFGLSDFDAYYRAARDRFLAALRVQRATYPLPVPHCAVCAWLTTCEQRREGDDHLCRVATLSREQARKLEASGVPTLAALANTGDDLTVRGIGLSTLGRLRHQARLQAARGEGEPPPVERLMPIEPGRGLAALPPPDPGDVFYDIEGDPYFGADGLEYLHGVGWVEGGELVFRPFWAHDKRGERRAFEELIDLLVERRRKFPNMHVYHYAPYEPSALGRLMGRHGTREDELDGLLRGNVFVDLYRVVRQGLVVGSPSYSLKKLEPLYMPARHGEITDAASSIVEYERWLQTQEQSILDDLEAYNRDDVESTWRLRGWLETQREATIADGHDLPRPWAGPDEEVETQGDGSPELVAVRDRLLDGVTEPPGENGSDEARVPVAARTAARVAPTGEQAGVVAVL